MSRYILVPGNESLETKGNNTCLLIPTEGLGEEIKYTEIPNTLVPSLQNEKSSKMLDKLMLKISKANISRSKDGLVTVGSRIMNTKFDDFVLDCCNGRFSECYEELYCLLRKNGITF